MGTFEKCPSMETRRPPTSIVSAAIQMSFAGIGVPCRLRQANERIRVKNDGNVHFHMSSSIRRMLARSHFQARPSAFAIAP